MGQYGTSTSGKIAKSEYVSPLVELVNTCYPTNGPLSPPSSFPRPPARAGPPWHRHHRLHTPSQPPGTSIEQPGRAPPPTASEGTSRALLDRAGLEQRGWPAPTRHTRSTVTEGLGRALARPTQPVHRPWSPSGRRRGSEVPVPRPRAWRSAAARLPAAAAGWAKSINPLLRHEVEGVHRLGSRGYQTGPSEPQVTTRGRATCTRW